MPCHSDPERSEGEKSRPGLSGAVCPTQSKIPRSARNDISWFLGVRRLTNMSDCFENRGAGETANMVLRLEMALDRAIDRKVRIVLTMRQEHARLCRGGSRTAPTLPEASPPGNEPNDRAAEELSKVVGLEGAEVAPNFSSAGAGLKASATDHGTESPKEENAPETSKSPEQSQNVIENKAPAVEEVRE
jgi:hypothetical protein